MLDLVVLPPNGADEFGQVPVGEADRGDDLQILERARMELEAEDGEDREVWQRMGDAHIHLEAERTPAIRSAQCRSQLRQQLGERGHRLTRDAHGKRLEGGAAEAEVPALRRQVRRDDAVLHRLVQGRAMYAEKS